MADNHGQVPSMNTQEKMEEALDQVVDQAETPKERKKSHKHSGGGRTSASKKHSHKQALSKDNKHKKQNDSFTALSALAAPSMKHEESKMSSMRGGVESTEFDHGGRKVRQYRCTLVGYSRCGKSALCSRFCENTFKNEHPKHKELLFKKQIDLDEMPTYRFMLDILDTQGAQEVKNREIVMEDRYRKRTNHIMLFVFSITSDKSFKFIEELLRIEYEQDQEYFERMGVVIVGNKCDLTEDREVETPDARDLARDYGAAYYETSAKTGRNVSQAFYEAVRKFHEKSGELEETMEEARKLNCCNIL